MTQNRRKFLKTTAATSLSLGITMPNLFAIQHRKKEKRLGIAILGLGGYGGGQVAPALLETKYCYLAGIVTGSPEKIPEWQEKYNIPDKNVYNYDNFDSIADNSDIDIVYVVTPNALHMPFVLRAAAAGKHVICEKPMDISSANCQIMMDACKKAKRKLQIGYRLRYEPRHLKLMELAKTKPFGKIQSIDTNFSFYGINNSNWRFTDPALSGGGPLMDIGIYCLDACRYATGLEPVSITAQKYKTVMDKLPGMEESIFWQMTFDDGIVANCGTSYVARRNYIWISAEKGNYGIEPAFSYRGLVGKIKDQVMEDTSTVRQQALQMDAYAQNILMDTEVVASGEHGKQDMIYIEAIYEAAETGKTILF